MSPNQCRYRSFSQCHNDGKKRNNRIFKSSSMPSLVSGSHDSCYFTDSSQNISTNSVADKEHFNANEALALVDRCFSCANSSNNIIKNRDNEKNDGNIFENDYSDSSKYSLSSIEEFLKKHSNSVRMRFTIKIGRINVSWKRATKNLNDEYHLKAYLLLDHAENKIKGKPYHRQWDQVLLIKLNSTNLSVGLQNHKKDLITRICFKNQEFALDTRLTIDRAMDNNISDNCSRNFRFHNKILRLKLERSKPGSNNQNNLSIGFVDIDLSQQKNLSQDSKTLTFIPMIIFSEYNKQMIRHNDINDQFIFEIGLNIRHQLIEDQIDIEPVSELLNNNLPALPKCNFCSTRSIYNLFGRTDSLANLSKDVELKCHEIPAGSKKKYFLNILGILPPAELYRVSIHFGDIDSADYLELYKLTKSNKIHASFEIKHHSRQPTIFHHHHQRHSLVCRTGNIKKGNEPIFNKNFTFFERFHIKDSPISCLRITDDLGHKLYKHRALLSEYVHCRSVKQYFNLKNKKNNLYCRLQFSISVKPITNSQHE